MNLCKKVQGKNVSGQKKPGIKNFGKMSEFSLVLEKKRKYFNEMNVKHPGCKN